MRRKLRTVHVLRTAARPRLAATSLQRVRPSRPHYRPWIYTHPFSSRSRPLASFPRQAHRGIRDPCTCKLLLLHFQAAPDANPSRRKTLDVTTYAHPGDASHPGHAETSNEDTRHATKRSCIFTVGPDRGTPTSAVRCKAWPTAPTAAGCTQRARARW